VACELNHISEHLIAVRTGVGVAGLSRFLGERDHDLVRIDEDVPYFARDIWLGSPRPAQKPCGPRSNGFRGSRDF
jgi:hypothetical protein